MPVAAKERTLTNFETEHLSLGWQVVNDDVMGGRSTSNFRPVASVLRFFGTINTEGGGFASIRTRHSDFNLQGIDNLRLRVRSDGRRYTALLRSKNTRISYRMDFSTRSGRWEEALLPITSFQASWRGLKLDEPPIALEGITQIGIMIADGQDGDFQLEIDWIKVQ
jgi:NADH dehydrogenase [ubiquinone] 1 alpha subcomplex assembly factor 1